ncbi:ribokinase [Curtobacterium sp. MCPF17_011]|uniref:ribokinase n=1 Tax=Curtobacterium sp. MCPF17_011 TaxID=2175652 RepID=UPI000DAA2689|nr:ribokinase [Curtobacterium sp. MCPF17_011]PZF10000.1 ribokinase [Curtobacterium sp. MCPF17_011]
MASGHVLVIGSVNYDYIVTQDRLPRRGETYVASDLRGAFGGKGANQAVQAARLGSPVRFIGSTGGDQLGQISLDNLRSQGVECHMRPTDLGNGLGIVHVTGEGDVYATIFEGANGAVDAAWVEENRELFTGAGAAVIQNEIPAEANERAVQLAVAAGTPVIYNAAPARPVPTRVSRQCAWFVVNEDEAAAYIGRDLGDVHDDRAMRDAVDRLRDYCSSVVLTLGSRGCYVATGEDVVFIEAIPTHAVDSTGAGDSFIGAFAHALVGGADPFAAAADASRVASITVEGLGAQSSMPTHEVLSREVL